MYATTSFHPEETVAAWGENGTAEMDLGGAQYGPNCPGSRDSLWVFLPSYNSNSTLVAGD